MSKDSLVVNVMTDRSVLEAQRLRLRDKLDYAAQRAGEWQEDANDFRSQLREVADLLAGLSDEEYVDPEFRFGDVVGSQDLGDKRRWQVVGAWSFPKFVEVLVGAGGVSEIVNDWSDVGRMFTRDSIPEKLYVFERLSKTTLPKHRGHDGSPLPGSGYVSDGTESSVAMKSVVDKLWQERVFN